MSVLLYYMMETPIGSYQLVDYEWWCRTRHQLHYIMCLNEAKQFRENRLEPIWAKHHIDDFSKWLHRLTASMDPHRIAAYQQLIKTPDGTELTYLGYINIVQTIERFIDEYRHLLPDYLINYKFRMRDTVNPETSPIKISLSDSSKMD